MSMVFFYVSLLIALIIMLVRVRNKKYTNDWNVLLLSIVLSIILACIFFIYTWLNMDLHGWNFITYSIISITAAIVYVLLFIISISMRKKLRPLEEKTVNRKTLFTTLSIIIVVFLLALLIEDLPYRIEQRNDRIAADTAKEKIIVLLENRYGDGDFEIIEMVEKNICYGCSWLGPGVDGYEFVMDTSYLDESFVVSLTKDEFEIYDNEFLSKYYQEKAGIVHLEEYLKDYKVQRLNETIALSYNIEIDFNNIFLGEYLHEDYGYIPSIDELSEFVELHDPKFEIFEDIYSEEELLKYLVRLTRYFISDLDTSNIVYSQTSKYFRYKYDYSKLGVYNYTDQYSGYGGYVLAGNYVYSDELERYVVVDEDSLVRINVMGNVTSFDIEDILKGDVE